MDAPDFICNAYYYCNKNCTKNSMTFAGGGRIVKGPTEVRSLEAQPWVNAALAANSACVGHYYIVELYVTVER